MHNLPFVLFYSFWHNLNAKCNAPIVPIVCLDGENGIKKKSQKSAGVNEKEIKEISGIVNTLYFAILFLFNIILEGSREKKYF